MNKTLSILTIALLITLVVQTAGQPFLLTPKIISLAYAEEKIRKDAESCGIDDYDTNTFTKAIQPNLATVLSSSSFETDKVAVDGIVYTDDQIKIQNLYLQGRYFTDFTIENNTYHETERTYYSTLSVNIGSFTFEKNIDRINIDLNQVSITFTGEQGSIFATLDNLSVTLACNPQQGGV